MSDTDVATRFDETGKEVRQPAARSNVPNVLVVIAGLGALVCLAAILWGNPPRLVVGVLVLLTMLLLMAIKIPIAIAMIIPSVFALFALRGYVAVAELFHVFEPVANWTYSVIPLFILMGIVMWKGGLTASAYRVAYYFVGRAPAGLAVATTVAGAGLAAGSGSTIGISYALGKMALPEMFKAGYRPGLATASVAMSGTLGTIIPPSLLLVIYAGIASVPVGPQLLAGVVPGVLLAAAFVLVTLGWGILRPGDAPKVSLEGVSWRMRLNSLTGLVPIAVIVLVVIGGIYSGVFSSTEAAAAGAAVALIVSWVSFGRGKRGWRRTWLFVKESFVESAISVGAIFLLLISVTVLTTVMTLSGLAQALSSALIGLNLDRVGLLLVLILVYVILGTFLEPLTMIVLTFPLLQATLVAADVDMLWFGIFVVILGEVAIVSPPVGILVFIVHKLAQSPQVNGGRVVTLIEVFRGVTPFILATLLLLVAFIFFPEIVTWLPDISKATS